MILPSAGFYNSPIHHSKSTIPGPRFFILHFAFFILHFLLNRALTKIRTYG